MQSAPIQIEIPTPTASTLSLSDRVLLCAQSVERAEEPIHRALARLRLASCLIDLGAWVDAYDQLHLAHQEAPQNPSVLRALGLMSFRMGRIEQGIRLYDQGRTQLPGFEKFNRPYAFRPWQGQDLSGKSILVWAEQGVGDQVMYARVLHDLVERGALVSVECEPRLIPLFQRVFPTVEFKTQNVTLEPEFVARDFDFQVSMFSAWRWAKQPGKFDETLKPNTTLVKEFAESWRRQDSVGSRRFNIGLSWSSKAASTGEKRTISPENLALLPLVCESIGVPVRFHNLQYDDRDGAALSNRLGAPLWTDNDCDPLKNLDRQCAQIKALDLVISIDNATVHLSGAMNVPTWVILPKGSEYRWGTRDRDCDLYPSVRLFRSPNEGVWGETLFNVAEALKEHLANIFDP